MILGLIILVAMEAHKVRQDFQRFSELLAQRDAELTRCKAEQRDMHDKLSLVQAELRVLDILLLA